MNHAIWEVNGQEYKLKLTASTTQELEDKIGCSLMNVMSSGVPTLKTTLTIIHCSMKKFNHGVKREDVNDIYDKYIEDGGSQIELFTNVVMNILKVSGFFSQKQAETMEKKKEEALAQLEE